MIRRWNLPVQAVRRSRFLQNDSSKRIQKTQRKVNQVETGITTGKSTHDIKIVIGEENYVKK
jgi:hypothetical protein